MSNYFQLIFLLIQLNLRPRGGGVSAGQCNFLLEAPVSNENMYGTGVIGGSGTMVNYYASIKQFLQVNLWCMYIRYILKGESHKIFKLIFHETTIFGHIIGGLRGFECWPVFGRVISIWNKLMLVILTPCILKGTVAWDFWTLDFKWFNIGIRLVWWNTIFNFWQICRDTVVAIFILLSVGKPNR